jgi:hypothetical protein
MTADVTLKTSPDFATVLARAAVGYRERKDRPQPQEVVEALLQAEKAAKEQRRVYPLTSLLGKWQLCFATGTKKARKRGGIILGKGFYVPQLTPAQISFSSSASDATAGAGKAEIGNQVRLGSLRLQLTGPARYLGKKNLLAFNFIRWQVSLFDRILYQGQMRGGEAQAVEFYQESIAKQPFFAFFSVTEDLIAARGRGGGLALWIRED